jgi:hypothetical protein
MKRRVLLTRGSVVALAVLIAGIALAACSGDDSATVTPLATATASPSASPSPTPFVHAGPPITHADASKSLPMAADDTHYRAPLGAYGDQIILQTSPNKSSESDAEGWSYSLWDPVKNTFIPEWTDAPGLQETYMQSDGDWLETVTRGFGGTAAMADWTIILRNLKTGEARTIAQAQPGQGDVNLTQITLQNDPDPSLAGGKLVWTAAELLAGEGVQSSVKMYDIASAATTTVEVKTDHAREDLWSASTGGGKVAWIDGDGTTFRLIILDLATQARTTLGADATFRQAKLTPDGQYVAVETASEGGSYDKYLIDVATGDRQQIASGQGWGVFTTPRYVSWDTASISGGMVPAGVYDIQTHILRSINSTQVVETNVAHMMGRWFAWQEMPVSSGAASGNYFFMELPY